MDNIPLQQQHATPYPRYLRSVIEEELVHNPVLVVMGARQVGKSTLCRLVADARGFASATLDHRDTREMALDDPEGLLASLGNEGAFIDEVQRAPGLFLAIKAIVDREQRSGRYLLSGSNQPTISAGVGDSLLGRAVYRTLRPLALGEMRYDAEPAGWEFLFGPDDGTVIGELEARAEASGRLSWVDAVRTGGFPRAVLAAGPARRLAVLDDYVRVFATRDIREVVAVESHERFEAFLRLLAARTGQILKKSGLATDLGVPVNTVGRWIDALRRTYLVELVPAFSRNAGHRATKAPKLVMVDSALALAAAREPEPTGFHLETLVANDLAIWRDMVPGRGLYHWRLASRQEVDFVLEQDRRLVPVEVKAATAVGRDDARHLRRFRGDHQNSPRGLLLSSDPSTRLLGDGIVAGPWWAVL